MLSCGVTRGQNIGIRLIPHRFRDGKFRVSKTKEGPYIAVEDEQTIKTYLGRGYSLRTSNRYEDHPPSLIRPKSIEGWK